MGLSEHRAFVFSSFVVVVSCCGGSDAVLVSRPTMVSTSLSGAGAALPSVCGRRELFSSFLLFSEVSCALSTGSAAVALSPFSFVRLLLLVMQSRCVQVVVAVRTTHTWVQAAARSVPQNVQ